MGEQSMERARQMTKVMLTLTKSNKNSPGLQWTLKLLAAWLSVLSVPAERVVRNSSRENIDTSLRMLVLLRSFGVWAF
jgi:MFS-type transporter involved in bile tolerance (Atg22 family)